MTWMLPLARFFLPRLSSLPTAVAPLARRVVDATAAKDPAFAAEQAVWHDALRLLDDDEPGLAPEALDHLWHRLDASLDRAPAAAPARPAWWSAGLPALSATACLAVVVLMPSSPPSAPLAPPTLGATQTRGDDHVPLGVRVRCVDGGVVVGDATAGARQSGGVLDCPAGAALAFSVTNHHDDDRYVFLAAVDESHQPVWLPPFSSDSDALLVRAGSTDVVLDTLAAVPAGVAELQLFLLVNHQPFAGGADVASRLAHSGRAGLPVAALDRLPMDVDVQARVTVHVGPRR